MLELLSTGVSVAAAICMALVVRGFWFMAVRPNESAVHYMSVGVVLVFVCGGARTFYWDALPFLLDAVHEGAWDRWHAMVGKPLPNLFFGLLWLAGSIYMLRLLWRLIPEFERHNFTIWTAPWYPRRGFLGKLVDLLRRDKKGN